MVRITPWIFAILTVSGAASADDSTLLSCRLQSTSASKDVQTLAIRFNQDQQRVWIGDHAVDASITDTEIFFDTSAIDPTVTVHFNIKRLTGDIRVTSRYGDVLMEGECKPANAGKHAAPAAAVD